MQAPVIEGREMQVDMKRYRDEGEGEGVKRKQRRLHATIEAMAMYVYEDASLPPLIIDALPSDLKGGAVGEAAERTRALLDRAKGSVLFIDE